MNYSLALVRQLARINHVCKIMIGHSILMTNRLLSFFWYNCTLLNTKGNSIAFRLAIHSKSYSMDHLEKENFATPAYL